MSDYYSHAGGIAELSTERNLEIERERFQFIFENVLKIKALFEVKRKWWQIWKPKTYSLLSPEAIAIMVFSETVGKTLMGNNKNLIVALAQILQPRKGKIKIPQRLTIN